MKSAVSESLICKNREPWLSQYIDVYNRLNASNLNLLSTIYHPDIVFTDPLSEINGLVALSEYLKHLYENTNACKFNVTQHISEGNEDGHQTSMYWNMSLSHKRLNKGQFIEVEGHSHLVLKDGLVIYQRDYFDVGSMIYEQLPVLGHVIKKIKSVAGTHA